MKLKTASRLKVIPLMDYRGGLNIWFVDPRYDEPEASSFKGRFHRYLISKDKVSKYFRQTDDADHEITISRKFAELLILATFPDSSEAIPLLNEFFKRKKP